MNGYKVERKIDSKYVNKENKVFNIRTSKLYEACENENIRYNV